MKALLFKRLAISLKNKFICLSGVEISQALVMEFLLEASYLLRAVDLQLFYTSPERQDIGSVYQMIPVENGSYKQKAITFSYSNSKHKLYQHLVGVDETVHHGRSFAIANSCSSYAMVITHIAKQQFIPFLQMFG